MNICVSLVSWKLRSIWWRISSKVFCVKKSAVRIKPIIFYLHDRYFHKLSCILKLYNQFFDVQNSSWTSACLLWVENWDPFGDESVPRCFVSKKWVLLNYCEFITGRVEWGTVQFRRLRFLGKIIFKLLLMLSEHALEMDRSKVD